MEIQNLISWIIWIIVALILLSQLIPIIIKDLFNLTDNEENSELKKEQPKIAEPDNKSQKHYIVRIGTKFYGCNLYRVSIDNIFMYEVNEINTNIELKELTIPIDSYSTYENESYIDYSDC